jgi:hypothetical protein
MGILPMIPRTRVARVKIVSETVLMYAYGFARTCPYPHFCGGERLRATAIDGGFPP